VKGRGGGICVRGRGGGICVSINRWWTLYGGEVAMFVNIHADWRAPIHGARANLCEVLICVRRTRVHDCNIYVYCMSMVVPHV